MTAQLMDRIAPAGGSVGVPMIRVASTGTRAMGIAETAVLATVTPRTAEAFQVMAAITDAVAGAVLLNAIAIAVDGVAVWLRTKANLDIEVVALGGTAARTVRWTLIGVA